ncbi:MAG: PEP-CTERM sorting domain-containing protein [Phycisphaerae bacterium]|nr:PEP-CTERM sorting domain-containing protein [Phycisphaerae bacterium]
MRTTALIVMALLAPVAAMSSILVSLPLDAQINLGYTYNSQSPSGDAIYPAFNSDTQTFFPGSHVRHNLLYGGGAGSWYYQYVDFNLAGITTPGNGLDLSAAGSTVTFDTRYYQDPEMNTNPYGDAPVFLRLYTYGADGNTYIGYRDYSIVYATQAPWSDPPYPTWTTVTVDVNATAYTQGGTFDVTNVSRLRWYGTDWSGVGTDFVDFRNLVITPEPGTLALLGLGIMLAARRRG